MVTEKSVHEQLARLGFKVHSWGRAEVRELPDVLHENEEIFECVNGIYEAGFALLIATNFRVLLIDKKPLNYLTVEDIRFDMINEIDYSHRMFGAQITISTGSKTLRFRSYNQPRLRKLINHVQHCMADAKQQQSQHQEGQNQHLERINQQLQTYLMAQLNHQQELALQIQQGQQVPAAITAPDPTIKPSPELADYLFAQSLLRQYEEVTGKPVSNAVGEQLPVQAIAPTPASPQLAELYAEGMQEVFGKQSSVPQPQPATQQATTAPAPSNSLEINALKIAYSKLPMALRNRKFSHPSSLSTQPVSLQSAPGQAPIL